MSIPEYTIRIISHKCDREFRKNLIMKICGKPVDRCLMSRNVTKLCYDIATIIIIDCDSDDCYAPIPSIYKHATPVPVPATINDIVIMEFDSNRDGFAQLRSRIEWIAQFKTLGDAVWCFIADGFADSDLPERACKFERNITHDKLSDIWCKKIDTQFGVRGIQTLEYAFKDITNQTPSMIELRDRLNTIYTS